MGISFFFYLTQGFIGAAVQFEFKNINILRSLEYAVHPSPALCLFNAEAIYPYKTENEIECVLEMLLGQFRSLGTVMRIVWDTGQESCEGIAESSCLARIQQTDRTDQPAGNGNSLYFEIITGQQAKETSAYFIIGEIQQIGMGIFIVILDSKISTLVNHGKRAFHISFVIGKQGCVIILPHQFIDLLVAMLQQPDQIGRRARGEPVVTDL